MSNNEKTSQHQRRMHNAKRASAEAHKVRDVGMTEADWDHAIASLKQVLGLS